MRSRSIWKGWPRLVFGPAMLIVMIGALPGPALARITQIQITRVESPAFGGHTFGDVGAYEKRVGRAFGELDPKHPLNAIIQDIDLAPVNAGGMVESSMDIYILKPVDLTGSNRMLLYEVVNRGGKQLLAQFNLGAAAEADVSPRRPITIETVHP